MLMRGAILVLAMAVTPRAALAESKLLHQVSCTVARFYVAKYSEAAAETWARGKCATETEIEAARICLKGVSVRTAQSTQ
jgi:hypothetical protein